MSDSSESNWERKILEKVALAAIAEQRRGRRWGIFFKLLGFVYLAVIVSAFVDWGGEAKKFGDSGKYTALVRMNGIIQAGGEASGENVIEALGSAFEDKKVAGIILMINSPGGSPVQSGMINDEIVRLRAKNKTVPLYVVVEDVCASGGYYVAAAADKIYVNKGSIVGSIGVLMDGFGFTGLMDKVGVERRLLTAGENKGFLDPFSPQTVKQKEYAQVMLNEIHQQFIAVVRKGRGTRLKETPDTFSGLFWSGAQAVELGLADGFGTVNSVARLELKAEDIVDYTQHEGLSERVLKKFGAAVGAGALKSMSLGAKPSLK